MSNAPADSAAKSKSLAGMSFTPHHIALVIMWLATTVAMGGMLLNAVRSTGQYESARYVLQVGYVAALLWFIIRTGPLLNRLPELKPQVLPRWKYGAWIPVLVIALLFVLTTISDDGFDILILLLIIATVWILLAWHRMIHISVILQGLAVALIAYFAGLLIINNGFAEKSVLYPLAGLSFPMYIAGGLLFQRTRLGGIQLFASQYWEALKSLLLGGCFSFHLASSMLPVVHQVRTSPGSPSGGCLSGFSGFQE